MGGVWWFRSIRPPKASDSDLGIVQWAFGREQRNMAGEKARRWRAFWISTVRF